MWDTNTLLMDLFQAYYDARKNKRNTNNQLKFEIHLERNLLQLYDELVKGLYQVGKSIYFIQHTPVKREIFAWSFRDRIIHHLIYNYIHKIFEKQFIYDSYSCREWKWTNLWVKRLQKAIRWCSENYTKDCYILKLDISWYFMGINKKILYTKVKETLDKNRNEIPCDYDFLLDLLQKVIFNNCTQNSIFKWKREDYIWLPKNKSLFFAEEWKGLPIWNLTSQLFSNIYLKDFDRYMQDIWEIKYYGRYVDDFYIVHHDKEYLKSMISKISHYLKQDLELSVHPKKIYLQHYIKGVLFLWVFIKPHRTYIRKRTIWFFYKKVEALNGEFQNRNYKMDTHLANNFLSVINSYLGMLQHHKSYKIRKKILLTQVSSYFWNHFYISGNYTLIKSKNGNIWKSPSLQNQLWPFNNNL